MGRRTELTSHLVDDGVTSPTTGRWGRRTYAWRHARPTLAVWASGVVLSVSACFPPVIHGPRIDDGLSIGGSVAITRGPTYTEGDFGGVRLRHGHVGLHTAYGWEPTSPDRPGFLAGIAVPIFFPALQMDLYMQLPPAWTRAYAGGLGVSGGIEERYVYGQFGRISNTGQGWFLTQGVGHRARGTIRGSSSVSLSGVAAQFTRRSLRTYVHLQFAYGREPGSCPSSANTSPCIPGEQSHAVSLGTTMEWRRPRRP